jgi:hypothetical protein
MGTKKCLTGYNLSNIQYGGDRKVLNEEIVKQFHRTVNQLLLIGK